jgi:hypothetical protein
VLLGSAVIPPLVAIAVVVVLWRSAKRHDEREAREREERERAGG